MDPIDRKHGNRPGGSMNLSVVVPAYRSERWVERTIRSAIAEGVAERNIIVVEDGVLDGTGKVVQATGARLFSLQQNGGAPHARHRSAAARRAAPHSPGPPSPDRRAQRPGRVG